MFHISWDEFIPGYCYRHGPGVTACAVQSAVRCTGSPPAWCTPVPATPFPFSQTLALMFKHLSSAQDVISNKIYIHCQIFTQIKWPWLYVDWGLSLAMSFISCNANYGNRQPSLVWFLSFLHRTICQVRSSEPESGLSCLSPPPQQQGYGRCNYWAGLHLPSPRKITCNNK